MIERTQYDREHGDVPHVVGRDDGIHLELGEWDTHAFKADSYCVLTPDEAIEVAADLMKAVKEVRMRAKLREDAR